MSMQLRNQEERYILVDRLQLLQQRIDKINEKLANSKAPLIQMTVSEPEIRRMNLGVGTRMLPVVKVALVRELTGPKGEVKMLALSTVDKTTQWMSHKTFTKLTPEQDEQVRLTDTPCLCDHCGTNRIRIYMYTLETEDGIKRIGSGCVDEFAGLQIRGWQAAYQKAIESIEQFSEIDFSMADDHSVVPVMDYLKEAIMQINEIGYMTRTNHGRSTAAEAFTALGQKMDLEGGSPSYPAATVDKASEVRDYILKSEADPSKRDEDYWKNLRSLIQFGHLTIRQASLLCSSVKSYESHLSKLQSVVEGAELANEYFGNKGERTPLKNLTISYIDPKYDGKFGPTTKITMYDEKNHLFEWRAAGLFDLKKGDVVHLVGTIDDQETFESKKYNKTMHKNILKRCKFHTLEEIDELIEAAKNPKPKSRSRAKQTQEEHQPSM